VRVLFASSPERAYLQAMVPLAWAARTAGHEVHFASLPELCEDITAAGLTAVPVGRESGRRRLAEIAPETVEAQRAGLPPPFDAALLPLGAVGWEAMRDGYEDQVRLWHKRENFPMIADLVAYARAWRPDLVIWEPTTYAGAIAARACGAAHGRLLWSIDLFAAARERYRALTAELPAGQHDDPMADWLGGYARRYGGDFGEDMVLGQFTIDQLPPSLRLPVATAPMSMRYLPYGGRAVLPSWLHEPSPRPRVALTLGITATDRYQGYVVDVPAVLRALADLDIEVVATIPEAHRGRLPEVPGNARIVPFVSLDGLAPSCAAVIHHAGPGTLRTATWHGVPQLALPHDFDEPELARRLAQQGAALVLDPRAAQPAEIREAVLRLLREPSFGDAAARAQAEMHAAPSPAEVVAQLELFVRDTRAGRPAAAGSGR